MPRCKAGASQDSATYQTVPPARLQAAEAGHRALQQDLEDCLRRCHTAEERAEQLQVAHTICVPYPEYSRPGRQL